MATSFDRWEKDPFFNAAEEVQESADRMESAYRTCIHAKRDPSCPWNSDELRRDLHTALGTAKWQLDEFERAVRSSYGKSSAEDAKIRHRDFIVAIGDKISKVEHFLQESSVGPLGGRKASLPWVSLDQGERNELALFLSGAPADGGKNQPAKCISRDGEDSQLSDRDSSEEKPPGHRRAASADADISSWKIAVSDDVQQSTSSNCSSGPMHKVASLSGFLNSVETISKLKWPKNGNRKLKAVNHYDETDKPLLPSTQLNGGAHACYLKTKSSIDSCDECYDKQLQGWYGAIHRQLQRSQYQMQYNRPFQITIWIVILLCLIVAPTYFTHVT
ncbi:uncharacterized protein LOC130723088 isoform X2 [Lotus japonicus]|uniref:uncharacterized protein LOC130723088 isoform X2 n=1 Tax=Lotus japonicus TaxID=34305 RepID=UPI00258CBFF5|nr:uncharacterized protein LOC130723088 isoform X2 [Lotus japonicus]